MIICWYLCYCHLKINSVFRYCGNLLLFVLPSQQSSAMIQILEAASPWSWRGAAVEEWKMPITTCTGSFVANYHWFFLLRFVARVPVRVRLPGGGIIKISQKLEIDNSFCDQQRPGDRTFQQPGSLGCCWLNKYQPTTKDKEQTLINILFLTPRITKDQSHALE